MRKLISFIFLTTILFAMLGISAQAGFAQTGGDPGLESDPDVFTFKELGYTERFMVGPYDNLDVFFSIPDNWKLAAGTYVQMEFSYTVGGASASAAFTDPNFVGGSLAVRFNNELLSTVLLTDPAGASVQLNVPIEAFETETDDGRHFIRIFLDASIHCDDEYIDTIVWIEPDSYVKFVYDEKAATNDLAKFPKPFYMADSIFPAEVALVIPDKPTSAEIEAGLAVSTGFGSITGGNGLVTMYQLGTLTPEIRENQHLIFIGTPDKYPELAGLNFPVTINGGKFDLASDVSDNGVVQSLQSPWNPVRSLLFVSGNSDEAVVRSAKAVSSGQLITSGIPNVSLVKEVSPVATEESVAIDQTLGDMGYNTFTLGLYGDVYFDIRFNATAEQAKSEGAYLDIVTTRSNLLDFNRSGVTLLLNDEVIGTLNYAESDSMLVEERIEILPNFLRRGENRLEFITSLLPYDLCYTTDLQATWVTLSDTSNLHLPVSERQRSIGERIDFIAYPLMFTGDDQFSNLAFVLPDNSPSAVTSAAKIAFYLGNQEALTIAGMDVYYQNEVDETILAEKDLIFVGMATQLPLIDGVMDSLPVRFESGSDVALEPSLPVSFSTLPGTPVGYVELLPSPWNPENSLMMVMGNSNEGVLMSADAVTVQTQISKLIGNYASVHGEEILSLDTRLASAGPLVLPGPTEEAGDQTGAGEEPAGPGASGQVTTARPPWLIPTILGTSGLMLIFIIIAAIRGRRTR